MKKYPTSWAGAAVFALILWTAAPGSLEAVIVAGANGGGNNSNNTTQSQLEAALGTAFPHFENVFGFSDSTGIYLGHNGSQGFVLTANHVTTLPSGSTFSLAGVSYTIDARHGTVGGADLAIYRFSPTSGSDPLPSLPVVALAGTDPNLGQQVVMIGNGRNRTEDATTDANVTDATNTGGSTTGYHWTGSILRWGTNNHSLSPFGLPGIVGGQIVTNVPGAGESFFLTFDDPGAGNYLSSNEAHASLGDSGSALFKENLLGSWELTGVPVSTVTLSGQDANTAAFGNLTISVNIAEYRDDIEAITGPLGGVPEPSTTLLGLMAGAWSALRRRR